MPPRAAFFITFRSNEFVMRKLLLLTSLVIFASGLYGQISQMSWELDYQIYLKLSNDSNYTYNIRDLFHITKSGEDFTTNYIFFPVNPGQEYIGQVSQEVSTESYKTLWSALQAKIGGGWIHFSNCIAYSLETQKLDLQSPLMKRPESKWKPNPMTDSYKRTSNWVYYIPLEQKNAQKEYKIKLEKGELGSISSLPQSYIDLMLNTSQKQYNKMKATNDLKSLAKIDMVKVLLGANYLGEAQINYLSNSVLKALQSYSKNVLPTVLVFDEFDAAAAMSLSTEGYKIESVVFRNSANLSKEEADSRELQIQGIVTKINEYNRNSFIKSLGQYYGN